MKKEIIQEVEIPKEVEVNIENNVFIIKGKEGENKKTFNTNKLIFEKKDNKIIIKNEKATKKEKKMINTIAAHIKNMIKGVQEKFEYKLKIVSSHFPISVEVKENEAIIKNFLGEKIPRKSSIPDKVDVKVEKDIITVTSHDKELAGQTAANFEKNTKIRMKDRRIFQDGIFITNKPGREI
jgi:large subunit ribosomal protein L6|tara:strand:+ start:9156 stop:9698 length:543 start_codon:yes stop_codon:yes gene_type:complete